MGARLVNYQGMDGRKCKKCGSSKTRADKKKGYKKWIRYENGWQCYDCYMGNWTSIYRKKGRIIEFHTVFEANRAANLMKWERSHHYGSVKFHVSYYMYLKIKKAGIGFWVVE
jgi:antibiotic biosynthesis monooxygenase (ABM) superfamily enzyme